MAKASNKQRGPHRINWSALAQEYIQGTDSLRAMAANHDIGERQLSAHCKSGDWVSKREEFRSKVCAQAESKAVDENAAKLTRGKSTASSNATMILTLVAAKLGMDLGPSAKAQAIKSAAKKLSSLELMRLSKSNEQSYIALCNALGVPVLDGGTQDVELPEDPLADASRGLMKRVAAGKLDPADNDD